MGNLSTWWNWISGLAMVGITVVLVIAAIALENKERD